jgi:hypothetical protein
MGHELRFERLPITSADKWTHTLAVLIVSTGSNTMLAGRSGRA